MKHLFSLISLFWIPGFLFCQDAGPNPVVITLGDSITKGARPGVTNEQTFTSILEKEFGVRFQNVGIGGERTDQALKRLDKVIALKPRIVTVMYGTNDSYIDQGKTTNRITVEAYRKNLTEIVERLLLAGVEPVLMTEPRWAADAKPNGNGENPNVALQPYIQACREVAKENDVRLVDHHLHWAAAQEKNQNLREWTTDGCHPNAKGHEILAVLMRPELMKMLQIPVKPVPISIELETVMKRENPQDKSLWFHPRVAAIPGDPPEVVMTVQKHLGASDHYSGMSIMRTKDLGKTWTGPDLQPELDWIKETGNDAVDIAVADVTPGFHPKTGRVIAIGAQVRYSPAGKQLEDKPRSHQTAYAVAKPDGSWLPWRRIKMPEGDEFNFARSACAQWIAEEDGTVLLPFYIGTGTKAPFSTTIVRCSFDGTELKYLEHGEILRLNVKRGLYEPSLIKYRGLYFLTMRNDLAAYVSVSGDGLNFRPPKAWTFDDGSELGSYNTQAHWLVAGNGLFLTYTRRGANNDHVIRHRAPLFIAQVDPENLHVIRATEKILVPERGATLGNFGVAKITEHESWVTVGEGNIKAEAIKRGADGSLFLARVKTGNQ
ncbi:MAG: hypothetical protein HKN23_10720 [Verrucomicrobiales bacterium]|nr:hypothetical protein [Verrucomicrobiales bacterium]